MTNLDKVALYMINWRRWFSYGTMIVLLLVAGFVSLFDAQLKAAGLPFIVPVVCMIAILPVFVHMWLLVQERKKLVELGQEIARREES